MLDKCKMTSKKRSYDDSVDTNQFIRKKKGPKNKIPRYLRPPIQSKGVPPPPGELKHYDCTLCAYSNIGQVADVPSMVQCYGIDAAGNNSVQILHGIINSPAVGTQYNQRIGTKIKPVQLQIKGFIDYRGSTGRRVKLYAVKFKESPPTDYPNSQNTVARLIWDRIPNMKEALPISSLYDKYEFALLGENLRNTEHAKSYKIIWEDTIDLCPVNDFNQVGDNWLSDFAFQRGDNPPPDQYKMWNNQMSISENGTQWTAMRSGVEAKQTRHYFETYYKFPKNAEQVFSRAAQDEGDNQITEGAITFFMAMEHRGYDGNACNELITLQALTRFKYTDQ